MLRIDAAILVFILLALATPVWAILAKDLLARFFPPKVGEMPSPYWSPVEGVDEPDAVDDAIQARRLEGAAKPPKAGTYRDAIERHWVEAFETDLKAEYGIELPE